MNSHLRPIYEWLLDIHPTAPWVVLALAAYVANLAVERLGYRAKLEAIPGWGPRAAKALRDLPGVILAAAWPALTLDHAGVQDAVLGAVSALVLPIAREAAAWFRKGPPGSGGGASRAPVDDELPDLPPLDDTLGRATLALFVVLCLTGCFPRPPERDACYARADADAFAAYVTECEGYSSTRNCPSAEAIEERHRIAQEACP